MLTNRFTEDRLDIEDSIYRFYSYFWLRVVSTKRDRVTVAVVDNGVVLTDSSANHWTLHLVMDGQRPEMFPFFLKHFSRDTLCGAMHLGVSCSLQPVQATPVQNVIIHVKAVA